MDITGVVYNFYSDECSDFYIGYSISPKTIQQKHRARARAWKQGKLYCKMRETDMYKWKVEIIEVNVPYSILLYRTQYYLDTLSPSLNTRKAVNMMDYDYYGNKKE